MSTAPTASPTAPSEHLIEIPELCLVALVGVSGSGKSTFAARHFGRYEVLSSDFCRGLVADDENDQAASADAFDLLGAIVAKRLSRGRLTVVDATNLSRDARGQLLGLARDHDVFAVAIVLDVPPGLAIERNASRPDRDFGARVVNRHHDQLRRSLRGLKREGFRTVHVLSGPEQIDRTVITRSRLYSNLRDQHGPFDVIGDVHGCRAELEQLLDRLGYRITRDDAGRPVDADHPQGRRVIFVGDLVDRGPDTPGVLRLAIGMSVAGHALAVPGNHEHKLVRALDGKAVTISHGLETTLAQLETEPVEFRTEVHEWCRGLSSHLVLDDGRLVVAHAGLTEAYQGRTSGRVRSFALYGDTTGETDEFGLPVRYPWAVDYRGRAMVLYGHTPTPEPDWVNNTLCLDTGCVFGGRLTALRYPERELVAVDAEQVWYPSAKPFPRPDSGRVTGELMLGDVLGRRTVQTSQHGRITIKAENAAGALEVMSRFALPPRWLTYLPPTMAPVGGATGVTVTGDQPALLEHPEQAFEDYHRAGVDQLLCEEKHMGSRAVVLVCRDASVARRRFAADADLFVDPDAPSGSQSQTGEAGNRTGVVYSRTGRAILDPVLTEQLLTQVRSAIERADLWQELDTDWLLLDAELLPWSLKAEGLLRGQYAAVGAAARASLPVARQLFEQAADRGLDVERLLRQTVERETDTDAFTAAYRRYCWTTDGLDGVQLAPFQLLAGAGATWSDHDHLWHLSMIDRLVDADPSLFRTTRRFSVDASSESSRADGFDWWRDLTDAGGEGMVVKPLRNLIRTANGLAQPGLKVRGREYLRLIYGPDYTRPENLARLRDRRLGHKRSLALREYALGVESLERLVRDEPPWRVHEAVFAVLALESEPIDPRL